MFTREMSDDAILEETGLRIARYRLNINMTQEALAVEAGISTPTVQRVESGNQIQTSKLIRILRVLNLIENMEALIPEIAASPIQQLKLKGRVRKRASSKSTEETIGDWSWGDE